jgi:hypothetical protein
MRSRRIISALVSVTASAGLLWPQSAYAYKGQTHEALARQSLLYMLRSNIPAVRFAGVVVFGAGEGYKAGDTGQRIFPLAAEARNVDFYRDVALFNKGNTPGLPAVTYDLLGNPFTAYDHFLLFNQNTSGQSYDTYPQSCIPAADTTGHCVPLLDKIGKVTDCAVATGVTDTCTMFKDRKGENQCHAASYPKQDCLQLTAYMDQHDNWPGYSLAVDTSVGHDVNPDDLSVAQLIFPAGSSKLQEFCSEFVKDGITATEKKAWFIVLGLLTGGAAYLVAEGLKPIISAQVGSMCPWAAVIWRQGQSSLMSHALIAYAAMGHSTAQDTNFQGRSMADVRWHPVDNLIAFGSSMFQDQQATRALVLQKTGIDAVTCKPSLADDKDQWAASACSVPRGLLLHLGRVMHGMADLGVAGHVGGHLLGVDHLVLEEDAQSDVLDFDRYTETQGEGGTIVPSYSVDGGSFYELDWLVDMHAVEDLIATIVEKPSFASKTLEQLAENAAARNLVLQTTSNASLLDPTTKRMPREVRRQFMSQAVVNQVVGVTRAVQLYYAANSTKPWDSIMSELTWTSSDDAKRYQPATGGQVPLPTMNTKITPIGAQQYGLGVEYGYQDYQYGQNTCWVTSHNWCSDFLKKPCLGGKAPGQVGDGPPSQAPVFVQAKLVEADLTLGVNNKAGTDESIHVTWKRPNTATSIFKGNVTVSAGKTIHLGAGLLTNGVAVWCSGPDIWNTEDVIYDASGNATVVKRVVCEVGSLVPTNAVPCDDIEAKILMPAPSQVPSGPIIGFPKIPGGMQLPVKPLSPALGPQVMKVNDLAAQYEVSATDLVSALEPAAGQTVTLTAPADEGRAKLSWTDESDGLKTTVTLARDGRVITHRVGPR